MKRLFDVLFASLLLLLMLVPIIFLSIAVKLTSHGGILYWSDRIGKDNKIFRMPKFRSMRIDTPEMATHLLKNPSEFLSPIGGFLRSSSLDELPQLYSIIKGDMSFVGPRPALFNQYDLISLRTQKGVDKLLPGVTGWAQVNGRDEISVFDKVDMDVEYLNSLSLWLDIKILLITFIKVIKQVNISH